MEFKTKFNKDDVVWYMKDNKPTEVKITCIQIFYVGTNQDRITYSATDIINPVTWIDHQYLTEEILFISKDELLKSL